MTQYEKNIAALEKRPVFFYQSWKEYVEHWPEQTDFQIEDIPTRESVGALTVTIPSGTFRLNSAIRPISEAKKWAEQFPSELGSVVISMFGLGNGLFLSELRKKMGKNTVLLVYEPSAALFFYAMNHYSMEVFFEDSRIVFIVAELDRLSFREELLKRIDYFNLESQLFCVHPQYEKAFPEAMDTFFSELQWNEERILVNKNTLSRFSHLIVKNTIQNLWILDEIYLIESLSSMIPKEIPIIIVSAGPSLDKNIEHLRKAKGYSLILCVDTAIKYLLQRGIVPDLTITIEPEKPFEHYQLEGCDRIPLICDIEANPKIVTGNKAKKFLYNSHGYIKNLLDSTGRQTKDIGSGGSVATAAFSLCYQLEFRTIIFVGQDLAYTGEATHAGGVESAGINKEIGEEWIPAVGGGTVRTRGDWLAYLRWFENALQVIQDMKKPICVIDATEGGAKIEGTVVLSLEQVIEDYCKEPFDFQQVLSSHKPSLSQEESKKVKDGIEESQKELIKIKEKARKGAEVCSRAIAELEHKLSSGKKVNPHSFPDSVKKASACIQKINGYIEAALCYPLLNNYAVAEIADELKELSKETKDPVENHLNYLKYTKLTYVSIQTACEAIYAMWKQK